MTYVVRRLDSTHARQTAGSESTRGTLYRTPAKLTRRFRSASLGPHDSKKRSTASGSVASRSSCSHGGASAGAFRETATVRAPPRGAPLRGLRPGRATRRPRTRPTRRSRSSCVGEKDLQCVRARRRQPFVRLRCLARMETVRDDAAGELEARRLAARSRAGNRPRCCGCRRASAPSGSSRSAASRTIRPPGRR